MNHSLIILATILVSSHAFLHGGDKMGEPNVLDAYARGALDGALEKFRALMKTGNSSLGLPVLDPLSVLQYAIVLDKEGLIEMDGLVTNVLAEGASSFEIDASDFTLGGLKVHVGLTFPEITAKLGYAVKGKLMNTLEFYGTGDISAIVNNFSFDAKFNFKLRNRKLYVPSMELKLFLGSLDLKITGLFDDEEFSELVSVLVSDMTPQLLADYHDQVAGPVSQYAVNFMNDFLKDKSLSDLLKIIRG